MMRTGLVLAALLGGTLLASPAEAQEAVDVTFEGEIQMTQTTTSPSAGYELGPGRIRLTLTPALDGVLRAEVADMRVFVADFASGLSLDFSFSAEAYYWPALPIEDGAFTLALAPSRIGSLLPPWVAIEGSIVSEQELAGMLVYEDGPGTTTWSAAGPAETPPGPHDMTFDALLEGGGALSVALEPDEIRITSFRLDDLRLDPCVTGERLSVRAFSVLGEDRLSHSPILGEGAIFLPGDRIVGVRVAEVEGSSASGTLFWRAGRHAGDCEFEVAWQTETPPEQEPTATASPVSTAEPVALPATGKGTANNVPLTGLAIILACLGIGFALLGFRSSAR